MKTRRSSSLFAEYGRATFLGHLIEKKIISIVALWRVRKDVNNESLMNAAVSSLAKKPLGHLIKIGLREGAFSSQEVVVLDEYRKTRNTLVHELSDIMMYQMLTRCGTAEVTRLMNDVANSFEGLHLALNEDYFERFERLGGDMNIVHVQTKELVSKVSSKGCLWENPIPSELEIEKQKRDRAALNKYLQLDELLDPYISGDEDPVVLALQDLLKRMNALATKLESGGARDL